MRTETNVQMSDLSIVVAVGIVVVAIVAIVAIVYKQRFSGRVGKDACSIRTEPDIHQSSRRRKGSGSG